MEALGRRKREREVKERKGRKGGVARAAGECQEFGFKALEGCPGRPIESPFDVATMDVQPYRRKARCWAGVGPKRRGREGDGPD